MADFNGIRIKNLDGFTGRLREYMKHTKRDLKTVLDTKAFYIARGAVRETSKADKVRMNQEIGVQAMALVRHEKGPRKGMHVRGKSARIYAKGNQGSAPLLALIINARRGKAGLPGLHGANMQKEMGKVLGARGRSIGFIKSGWLPAIRELEKTAEQKNKAPQRDASAKQYGTDKGGATPASSSSLQPFVKIVNSATTKRDIKQALITYGLPALEKAWNAEIASMDSYLLQKAKERAKQSGFKVN